MALYRDLKHSSQFTEWILVCYKPICCYSGCVSCNRRWENRWCCTNSASTQLKSARMDCLLWYMVINDLWDMKRKVFTFKHSLNKDSFVSKYNKYPEFRYTGVANTYTFNIKKECMIFSLKLRISVLFRALITKPA